VFRLPANHTNGHTRDRQGRLVSCEHGGRRLSRTELDGSITVLADRYQGKRLNSPNDVVVKSDGSVWFTDPTYGIDSDYEGHKAESEIGASHVYRLDPASGALEVAADAVVAERLGLEGSTPLLYLERLRLAGEEPLALDRVWLPAEMAEPLLRADFSATALYTELAERCGVRLTGGTEHIRAVVPTAAERELLGVPGDVAAFAIERTGYVGDRPVEWRHTLVRGDRFAVNAEFSGRAGYSLGVSAAGRR